MPAGTGSEEIGWEELDDLSQVDGVVEEEREYTFEEADAATLAELGISPDEVASEAAEEEKPKRRTRTKKADAADAEEPKPKRTRAKKADAADGEDKPKRTRTKKADAADDDEKPKRRTRSAASEPTNRASAEAADGGDGGEPQGIWGRFRSARKPRATTSS